MESRKTGLILIIVGLVFLLLNFLVVYPFINCTFAPLAFWGLVIACIGGGVLLYFDVKIFHSD